MKSVGLMSVVVLSAWMLAASAVAAPGVAKDKIDSQAFTSTNLGFLKQADGQQKPATNWPVWIMVVIGALTVVNGALVTWVAVQQYRLARETLKLDLFEKRFAVYKAAQKFLETVVCNPPMGWDEPIEFSRGIQDAVFLFAPDIVEYLNGRLYRKASEIINLKRKYEPLPEGPDKSALFEEAYKLGNELKIELAKLPERFAPYLRFRVYTRKSWLAAPRAWLSNFSPQQ
jgi:hypothetical protein